MPKEALISLERIHVTHWRWGQSVAALRGINLKINAGEWVMLSGHNGSGKSTLLKVIAGQLEPTQGEVHFGDPEVSGGADRFDSQVFHVSQDPLLGTAEGLTLLENLIVADPRHGKGMRPSRQRRSYYQELLAQFDLTNRSSQLLRYFSGGERQQVALLIAKLRNPMVLLLDEPFAALDAVRLPQSENLIASLSAGGSTILQVTHDLSAATSWGHRTIVMESGMVLHDSVGEDRMALVQPSSGAAA